MRLSVTLSTRSIWRGMGRVNVRVSVSKVTMVIPLSPLPCSCLAKMDSEMLQIAY